MPTPQEITEHHNPDPMENPWVHNPAWPEVFAALADRIRGALGDVADSADEDSYLPALEGTGFELTIRERSWHQHRCLVLTSPRANLHVFSPDCAEVIRHRIFRDWLIAHPDDRALYEAAKRDARVGVDTVSDYNQRKQPVIRDIYDRAFRASGLL
jgi:Uncharacterized conserved protein